MSRILTTLVLAALTGCASVSDFTQAHPRASAVIAGSIVTSVALSTRGHRDHERVPEISTPLVDCDRTSCL